MKKAQLCPVCLGSGLVNNEPGYSGTTKKTCHGCSGKGWVTVGDDYEEITVTSPNSWTGTNPLIN